MAGKNIAVFGIYTSRGAAEEAVDHLRTAGFRNEDVSVLFPENLGNKDLAHEKNTKAPEGATTGGVSGAVIGGTLGWLAGIGALAIPGIGPFIAAGPIMGLLGGMGVGGAVGGIAGPWSEWEFRSMKRSGMQAVFAKAAFCCRCTPTTATGPSERGRFSNRPEPTMSGQRRRPAPISPRPTGLFPGDKARSGGRQR